MPPVSPDSYLDAAVSVCVTSSPRSPPLGTCFFHLAPASVTAFSTRASYASRRDVSLRIERPALAALVTAWPARRISAERSILSQPVSSASASWPPSASSLATA